MARVCVCFQLIFPLFSLSQVLFYASTRNGNAKRASQPSRTGLLDYWWRALSHSFLFPLPLSSIHVLPFTMLHLLFRLIIYSLSHALSFHVNRNNYKRKRKMHVCIKLKRSAFVLIANIHIDYSTKACLWANFHLKNSFHLIRSFLCRAFFTSRTYLIIYHFLSFNAALILVLARKNILKLVD